MAENNDFEVGKFYKHERTNTLLAVRCEVDTTQWGRTLLAESTYDPLGLRPIGTSADGWMEIPEEEWLSRFSYEQK